MRITPFILIALSTLSGTAQNLTFSFLTDTWISPTNVSTSGFVGQTGQNSSSSSSGTTTKSGVTLMFGASFVGGADSGGNFSGENVGSSLTNATGSLNPNGFLMSTSQNDSPGFTNGISASLAGSTITSYQRWYFEFSVPVILDQFIMQDIDNVDGGFRDILGAEAYGPTGYGSAFTGGFNPSLMPIAGSGINPQFQTFGSPTALGEGSANIGLETLAIIAPMTITGNPSSTANVRAGIDFGSGTLVKAFSVYAISNENNVHRMSLNQSSFSVAIPEPSTSALAFATAFGWVVRRRRR